MISEILNDLRNYARINVKPGKGGGCRQGWGFVSVTRNFCKTPMGRASKNRQIKFKVPTPGAQNTSKNRYQGEISGHDIIRSLYESVVLHRDTSILKVYDTKFANLPRYKWNNCCNQVSKTNKWPITEIETMIKQWNINHCMQMYLQRLR